ncbi:MAG TPA: hypothetical protein CFH81_00980 [Sulfurovum sp. UBA12169]|nr:MAG TPA: hypothetical protein CFH81_00980 [Sulfurovum sp. UBA12169]
MKKENEELLSKVGLQIGNDEINIDLAKTKDFFGTMQKQFEETAQNISEGKMDMPETVGITVNEEQIHVDLNKAKSFIEDLGKKIEKFLGEIDKAVDKLDHK